MAAATTPKLNWVKDVNGQRYVKALIVSNADDPDLTPLRAAVMGAGGSFRMKDGSSSGPASFGSGREAKCSLT